MSALKSDQIEQKEMLPGIFCLEGEWEEDCRDRSSVLPLLELLEAAGSVPYVHRRVASRHDLGVRLRWWLDDTGPELPVAYLSAHGSRRTLWFGDDEMSLDDLAETMGTEAAGRVVYLSGCNTLGGAEEPLMQFCRVTGVKALAGYTKQVDWIPGASFELVLLRELVTRVRIPQLHERMLAQFPHLTQAAGFRMATRDWVGTA